MTTPTFAPAVKAGAHARVALVGQDDATATLTALRMAQGFGGPIGLIDTNARAASKYADLFDFDTMSLEVCDPRTLTWACAAAADAGYRTLIVASLSSFWSGRGGMLEQVDVELRRAAAQSRPASAPAVDKNTGWNVMRPHERTMYDALRHYPGNVVVTVRQKVDYVVSVDDAGRAVPRTVGTQPDQAGGWDHHFDQVITLLDGDTAQITRSRAPELAGQLVPQPGVGLAETIAKWLARDAVGEPGDPIAARDWVLGEDPTLEAIRARFYDLDAANQVATLVHVPAAVGRRLGLVEQARLPEPVRRVRDAAEQVERPWIVPIGELLRRRSAEIIKAAGEAATGLRSAA